MSSKYQALQIDGVTVPHAKKEGYSVAYNKVWSKNTGRSADATMLGDIVAIKRTIKQVIDRMTEEELKPISTVIDSQTAFHTVRFYDTKTDTFTSGTFYAADMTYTIELVKNGTQRYKDIQIELIEQ